MKHQTRRPAGTAARRTVRGLTVLLAALVSVAGCASMYPRLETPRLSLVSVEMAEATLFERGSWCGCACRTRTALRCPYAA